ncbi:hypothetical protein BT96DRAFT_1100608 [Gymnopus androsaceus JB14]|uniref:Endoplasmic reticulum-based factor for assembly of V-ATPase n=1 Tax=Gymnopus androsaceus JB14 TaxID=1447944 RepID=A0A6A4HN29_9AGAR|nr:hypothetical protein BT96DRAFT_1100608 [Gymnopus androsaceus JB14]
MSESNVNVSLEPHLISALEPLLQICDPPLSNQLAQHLTQPIIPYSVLQSVSRWSRSPAGSSALRACSPPLDPNSYSMIALLAGTTTSPERKFGSYVPPQEPDQIMNQQKRERKAITTIINGVLSVIGSGAAAWLGSERTSWKQEWRVLFAFFVAVIVAVSETVLYIIWQSRSSSSSSQPVRRKYIRAKKQDGDPHSISATAKEEDYPDGLRLRIQATTSKD